MDKKTRIAFLGLAAVMAATLVGCAQITQSNAADAAAVVGLGSAKSLNSPHDSRSILARTVMDNEKAIKATATSEMDFSVTYGGGKVTFASVSSASMPSSNQDGGFITLYNLSITYSGVTVTHDGKDYELGGTIYMRFATSVNGFDFILTGDIDISGAIDDTAEIDVLFNAGLTGYTFTGTVNGYQVEDSFTIS